MIVEEAKKAQNRAFEKSREAQASEIIVEVKEAQHQNDIVEWTKEFESRSKFWKGVPPETIEKANEAQNRVSKKAKIALNPVSDTAKDVPNRASEKANIAQNSASDTTIEVPNQASEKAKSPVNPASNTAKEVPNQVSENAKILQNSVLDESKNTQNDENTMKNAKKVKHHEIIAERVKEAENSDLEKATEATSEAIVEEAKKTQNTIVEWNKEFESRAKFWKEVPSNSEKVMEKTRLVSEISVVESKKPHNRTSEETKDVIKGEIIAEKAKKTKNYVEANDAQNRASEKTNEAKRRASEKSMEDHNRPSEETKEVIKHEISAEKAKEITNYLKANDAQNRATEKTNEANSRASEKALEDQNQASEIFLEEAQIDLAEWNKEFESRAQFWKGKKGSIQVGYNDH